MTTVDTFDLEAFVDGRGLVERLNEAGRAFCAHERYPWWPDAMMGACRCAACGRDFATSEPRSFGYWDPRSSAHASRFNWSIECHHGPAVVGALATRP